MKVTKCKVFYSLGAIRNDLARDDACQFISKIGLSLVDVKIVETTATDNTLCVAVYYQEEKTG